MEKKWSYVLYSIASSREVVIHLQDIKSDDLNQNQFFKRGKIY